MKEHEIEELKEVLRETVRITVNGKIDRLRGEVQELNTEFKDFKKEQSDFNSMVRKHISSMNPLIPFAEGVRGMQLLKSFALWTLSFGLAIGGIVSGVWAAIKYISTH